jgi:hypothetical protein
MNQSWERHIDSSLNVIVMIAKLSEIKSRSMPETAGNTNTANG